MNNIKNSFIIKSMPMIPSILLTIRKKNQVPPRKFTTPGIILLQKNI